MKRIFHIGLPLLFVLLNCEEEPAKEKSDEGIFKWVNTGRIANDGGLSRGVAWGDYDGDGDPDLYVANSNGQWNALYRNEGNGNFKKMTASSEKASEMVIHGGNSQGVSWVDYDNDGDLDLYVVSRGDEANFLFRNDSLVAFTRITDSPITAEGISASMACWADMDKDGDLDVFLAGYDHPNLLFENKGGGQFESLENNLFNLESSGRARACACADTDQDGLPEIYVANARQPNAFFNNKGDLEFEKVQEGHLVEDVAYSYGLSWADYDDDGDLDLFVANFDKENFLYENDGKGNFNPLTEGDLAMEKGGASKGHTWGDYDNDTDLDLFIANGTYGPDMRNFLFLNQGDKTFKKDLRGEWQIQADTSAGAAHADFDRDGDLDIFVANWGSNDQINRLYENVAPKKNWFALRLRGEKSNKFGIGAKVEVFLSDQSKVKKLNRWMYPITGFASQNDYELHFGLGDFTVIDSLRIHWPSEIVDVHTDLEINRHLTAVEGASLEETP